MGKKSSDERILQKAVLDYLQLMENRGRCWCFRAGSGSIKTEKGNWFKTGKSGLPDIVCCIQSRFVGFEIKTKNGRLTENQKTAKKQIENQGGEYHIIRSLEDIERYFETH